MEKPKIYLAGKITKNSWRSALCSEKIQYLTRNAIESVGDNYMDYYEHEYETDDYIITGPHSISCDHGCWHDFVSNHAAVGYCCGCGQYNFPKDFVTKACLAQIDKSDFIFSYITGADAYGTISEIGYAKALKKKIYILFADAELSETLWFIRNMADHIYIKGRGDAADEIRDAFQNSLKRFKLNK